MPEYVFPHTCNIARLNRESQALKWHVHYTTLLKHKKSVLQCCIEALPLPFGLVQKIVMLTSDLNKLYTGPGRYFICQHY